MAFSEGLFRKAPEGTLLRAMDGRGFNALESLTGFVSGLASGGSLHIHRTYCVHAEVVSNTIPPASTRGVSCLLAVLEHPFVHTLEGHGVVRRFFETPIE